MNLKERGITVGDLLLILIIIFSMTLVIRKFNKDKQTSHNFVNQEIISYKKI